MALWRGGNRSRHSQYIGKCMRVVQLILSAWGDKGASRGVINRGPCRVPTHCVPTHWPAPPHACSPLHPCAHLPMSQPLLIDLPPAHPLQPPLRPCTTVFMRQPQNMRSSLETSMLSFWGIGIAIIIGCTAVFVAVMRCIQRERKVQKGDYTRPDRDQVLRISGGAVSSSRWRAVSNLLGQLLPLLSSALHSRFLLHPTLPKPCPLTDL